MNKQTFIKQLEKLVSFKTISGDYGENQKALDYVVSQISTKAKFKRIKNGGVEMLLAGNTESLAPNICFLVHSDVVAAKPEQFSMKVQGNKAYGRGVSDMKFSAVMGIELLNQIISDNSKISFCFAITTDEETGGFKGAYHLANNMKFRPKLLIVPDGGDNLVFINKSKGVCQLVVESTGIPAHSSRPWLGKNALEPLVQLASALLNKYGENNKSESWKTTINIGQIEGGKSTNQVCPSAVMKLDFRFPETDSISRLTAEVMTLAKKIDSTLVVTQASTGEPTFTDENSEVVKLFLESMREATGEEIPVEGAYGASDARHFAPFDIPILMTKPKGGDIHGDGEWIDIDSCLKYLDGIFLFLKRMENETKNTSRQNIIPSK